MQGYTGSNLIPLVCSNIVRREGNVAFYGRSFISDQTGMLIEYFGSRDNVDGTQMNAGYLVHTFELIDIRGRRVGWGVFRDQRPKLYGPIAMSDRGYG
jgi:N-carbamoylputrescine amidase